GIIDVLIEPIENKEDSEALAMLEASQQFRSTAVMATVFRAEGLAEVALGDRILQLPDGKIENKIQHSALAEVILADFPEVLVSRRSNNKIYHVDGMEVEVFLEAVNPSIHLMIFGAGYDAIPVSALAKNVGWKVSVSDDCPAHLAPRRFPQADEVVCIPRDSVVGKVDINDYTAAVLMSHSFKYDLAILKELLKTDIPYIGILGPKKRFEKMKDALNEAGIMLREADLERIHNPIGLDLGAETPEEIALSIVSEIQAKFRNRPGSFLKYKEGFIHDRVERPQAV
ncbi:MAG: XdhC family protein, partial [Bacteroidota bacterium]